MNRRIQASILAFAMVTLTICTGWNNIENAIFPPIEYISEEDIIHMERPKTVPKKVEVIAVEKVVVEETKTEAEMVVSEPEPEPIPEPQQNEKPEISMSKEDMELIAWMTMAEAEGESEYGQRLVIDTILNRVDSSTFPDSVYGVLYQPYQFSSIKDGRFGRCYVKEELYDLVVEEVQNRTNHDVIFFRTGHYSEYGTPLFKEGAHYFNSL